jgi:hypothetical protein
VSDITQARRFPSWNDRWPGSFFSGLDWSADRGYLGGLFS